MITKLNLLELTRDQAEILTLLEAPTATVLASIALETVGGYLRDELYSSESGDGLIRILVSDFYLDWVITILEVYSRPPYMEYDRYKIEDLLELYEHLRRMKDLHGNIPCPELVLLSSGNSQPSGNT